MNLIEQQSAAKDLPMQYLQQAVNGQNPNLTPWIATAELQRRTTMNQHMAPQGPQGPQPTVKDQVEQKAGLMATQQAQQAQAAQAQQSSAPPGPVPGGIPQPEPQPEQPVMAARGGLMNAPVNFKFAHGGILGFAEAGSVPEARDTFTDSMGVERDAKTGEPVKPIYERMADWRDRQQAQAARPQRQVANAADERMLRPVAPSAAATAAPMGGSGRGGQGGASAAEMAAQGIKAALPQPAPTQRPPMGGPQRAPAPKVAPQQVVQQAPAMDPNQQIAADYAKSATPQASLQGAINNEQLLAQKYGLDQPMGVDEGAQQARQDEVQKRQQAQAQRLARAAGVAASVGTPGSESLAYNQTLANALGKESEYEGARYKNIADLAAAKRAAQEKRSGVAGADYTAQQKATADALKDKATVAAQMFNISAQAASNAAQNMTSLEVARINAASAARPGETERIMATAIGLKATNPAKYAAFMETLNTIRGAGKADQGAATADKAFDNVTAMMKGNPMLGIKYAKDPAAFQAAVAAETARLRGGASAGGAGSASGATRLKFDAQGNQIK